MKTVGSIKKSTHHNKCIQRFSVFVLGFISLTGIASAEQFTVSNEGELLAALQTSSENQQNDQISLGGNTIELTAPIVLTNEAGYNISIDTGTIQPLSDETSFRLLQITAPTSSGSSIVEFVSMTFENGRYNTADGSTLEAGGGAIYSDGVPVEISSSTFNNNKIDGSGAGGAVLVASASLTINNSAFTGNQAITMDDTQDASGGAIATIYGTTIAVTDSVFTDNTASRGGAIAPVNQSGATSIISSTFLNNDAEDLGGAIWTRSKLEVDLSTFYGNNADTGGGVVYFQPLNSNSANSYLRSNTFVNNTAGSVGGVIYFLNGSIKPELSANLIIGNNINGNSNCTEIGSQSAAVFSSQQNNISDDDSCGTALVISDGSALFTPGSPAYNGGATPTIALSSDSVAIDAGGAPGEIGCGYTTDQRGVYVTENCDVGSYEFVPTVIEDGIKTAIATIAADLDTVIAGTTGAQKRILTVAATRLTAALADAKWTNENTLTDDKGTKVFNRVRNAIFKIEQAANLNSISDALKVELEQMSNELIDNLRLLTTNEITAAISANGTLSSIESANENLSAGDESRDADNLKSAAVNYRNAWNMANTAY